MHVLDRRSSRLPRRWRTALDWAVTLVVAVGFVLVFEAEIARPYRIPSASMERTLHCARPALGCEATFSDRVIACELCLRLSSPSRGDIVVFHSPARAARVCSGGGVYVKRLVGLPGEVVHESRSAFISIDGKPLAEPYVSATARAADVANDPSYLGRSWRVPQGEYFMLGDNRGESCDSRAWGPVPVGRLIGTVVATYWPPNRLSLR